MKMRTLFTLAVVALTVPAARAITIDFEGGAGLDGQPVSGYTGISFINDLGDPWVFLEGAYYNCSSYPSGIWGGEYWIHDNVGAWCTQNTSYGRILVDNADATYFDVGYSVGNTNFYLEAYDSSNNLLDSDVGPANLRFTNGNPSGMNYVHVDAPLGQYIAYVIVHDSGNFWVIDNVSTDATGVHETVAAVEQPAAFHLAANAPNPFNPTTTIRFSMEETAPATLTVYDVAGREVSVLWNGMAPRGETRVVFDASALPSGLYLYTLEAMGQMQTQKMVLVK
jgi:hypothetical protein